MIPSSSADVTLALRGCLRGGSVYVVSFRFKAKENLQCCGKVFFDILIRSKKALNVDMFQYISKLKQEFITQAVSLGLVFGFFFFRVQSILVPRAYDPSGLRQESRALGATISGMRHRRRLS